MLALFKTVLKSSSVLFSLPLISFQYSYADLPGAPALPATPFSPFGPGAPVTPSLPAGPGCPASPLGPAGPTAPACPGSPLGPAGPAGPTAHACPGSPLSPFRDALSKDTTVLLSFSSAFKPSLNSYRLFKILLKLPFVTIS